MDELAALQTALALWSLPERADLTCVNSSENQTFRAEAGGRSLILRLHRAGHRSDAEIASELDWLQALAQDRVTPVVAPVAGTNGRIIQHVSLGGQLRQIVAFVPIKGAEPRPGDSLGPWFYKLGAITARLHAHTQAWRRPATFTRPRWDAAALLGRDAAWGDWRDAVGLDAPGRDMLEQVEARLLDRLASYGTGPDRFGLIHADLRLANLLVDEARIWAIDFDDCGFGWYMFDLAAALSFIETQVQVPALVARWCEGYAQVAPLSEPERDMLPDMLMMRRLQLTAWLTTRAGNDTAAEFGGAGFAKDTVRLGARYLARAGASFWHGGWP